MKPAQDPAATVPWWRAEPSRLARDRRDIARAFPDLTLDLTGQGTWDGVLPRWPFQRPEPEGLPVLLGETGLRLRVQYVPAYPMVLPLFWPCAPEPELSERTQQRWHVLPVGALCLLQTEAAWEPNTSIADLLLKAAGWRVEYALMKAGVIDSMSVSGIVSDSSGDPLIVEAAAASRAHATSGEEPRSEETSR
jgi:hypothetical protein